MPLFEAHDIQILAFKDADDEPENVDDNNDD